MDSKKLIVILSSVTSNYEEKPIIKSFEGSEKEKMINLTLHDIIDEMCKDPEKQFSENQRGIAAYCMKPSIVIRECRKLLEEGKIPEEEYGEYNLELRIYDENNDPKICSGKKYNPQYISLGCLGKDYMDEREQKGVRFDVIDMSVCFVQAMDGGPMSTLKNYKLKSAIQSKAEKKVKEYLSQYT